MLSYGRVVGGVASDHEQSERRAVSGKDQGRVASSSPDFLEAFGQTHEWDAHAEFREDGARRVDLGLPPVDEEQVGDC